MCQLPLVVPYSYQKLLEILAECSGTPAQIANQTILRKLHGIYFKEYFEHLEARTIVVEREYIDRDFLEDYAAYYVRCFAHYGKRCTRLHFFARDFAESEFNATLAGSDLGVPIEEMRKDYLGFVVVKPLPQTIIGRTCLRTYKEESRRCFPATREYTANLYGLELSVCTLAFQEQDTVAAACATSALWSVFQGTGKLFQHHIPSPIEITKTAAEHWMSRTRILPNTGGLTAEQMAYAIRKVDLEPLLINPTNEFLFQSTLYAYLKCGIPLLLGGSLKDFTDLNAPPLLLGKHAVALTGYSLGRPQLTPEAGFLLNASRIDKIYVHDDQVGPFARMKMEAGYLSTSWRGKDGNLGKVRFFPEIMLLPLYHKIRIPFQSVLNTIMRFDAIVEKLRAKFNFFESRIVWDISLTTVNKFKTNICQSKYIDDKYRINILKSPLPRYLWQATAWDGATPVLDLLLDATDIEQGDCLCLAVKYDNMLSELLRIVLCNDDVISAFTEGPEWRIIHWFRDE